MVDSAGGIIRSVVGAATSVIIAASKSMVAIVPIPVWPMADSAAHQYRQCKTHNCNKHDWPYRYFQKIAFHQVTFLSSPLY
ncbi:MAG: hypothetical protein VR64_12055 [Desulfatitalea sp. BRH_c12]|nr:MAG: hypothetical protein VR64_12055 [Desulfatitalea sp. BRH_c12]